MDVNSFILSGVIATFSVLFTFIGLKTGKFLSKIFQTFTDIAAGILLILLGTANFYEWN